MRSESVHDRQATPSGDVIDCRAGTLDVLRRVEARRGIDEIDHVIADTPALLWTRLVGRDVEPLVHLARIGDDDLSVEAQRELKRETRLADARRPDDDGDLGQ